MRSSRAIVQQLLWDYGATTTFASDPQLDAAVRRRMSALKVQQLEAYETTLESSPEEQQKLIDELLIKESYFFRDQKPFTLIAERFKTYTRPLRILCAPSAAGEEPYSVAIALLEAGVPSELIAIEAIDISVQGIANALTGCYGASRLRQLNSVTKERFFIQIAPDKYRVDDTVKACVNFERVNALELAGQFPARHFDMALSRNLLIYLRPDARSQLLTHLSKVLKPSAPLIVGHAEAGFLIANKAKRVGDPGCFAFELTPEHASKADHARVTPPVAQATRDSLSRVSTGAAKSPRKPCQIFTEQSRAVGPRQDDLSTDGSLTPSVDDPLTAIGALADAGDYATALAQVENFLQKVPGSADGHALQGLVLKALGEPMGAIRCLERALYLNGAHQQSIDHLSLLYQATGNQQGLARMRRKRAKLEHYEYTH